MDLHRPTGNLWLGLALALTTMLLWAALPLALTIVLKGADPPTITWFRFTTSALVLALLLRARLGRLQATIAGGPWVLLVVATVFLAINYYLYLVALSMMTPANAQVLIQLAPLLLALGGIFIFGEHFTRTQWLGFAVLVAGLGTFFNDQLGALVAQADRYILGVITMAGAAATWAVYGLAQKQMLQWLPSQLIMLCIYAGCSILFLPLSTPTQLAALSPIETGALIFCAFNTLASYGAFSEALAHWEASRVSAVLALTPLTTLLFGAMLGARWPGLLAPEHLSIASIGGAGLVVAGSMLTALGGRRGPTTEAPRAEWTHSRQSENDQPETGHRKPETGQ